MKTLRTLLLIGAAALLGACAPAFTALPDAQIVSNSAAFNTIQNGESVTGTLTLSSTTAPAGNLKNTAGQVLLLNFNQAIDASTVAGAIRFYNLTDASSSFAAYTATLLSNTPSFSTQGSQVAVTLDLTGASAQIEMRIEADKLTGYTAGTRYRLNPNGNAWPGEAGEIDIRYFNVSTNTATGATAPIAATIGNTRDPYATVPVTFAGYLAANGTYDVSTYNPSAAATSLSFTWQDTGSANAPDNNKVTVESAAVQVFRNVNGLWVAQDHSLNTVSDGTLALNKTTVITLTPAPQKGQSYKVVLNRYHVLENVDIRGFRRRGNYNPFDRQVRYVTFANNSTLSATDPTLATGFNGVHAPSGRNTRLYITVTTTEAIDLSTVSAASLKVKVGANQVLHLDGTPLADADAFLSYTLVPQVTSSEDLSDTRVRSFRLYLPESLRDANAGAGFTGEVWFAPSVLTTAHSTDSDQDRLSFGDPAGTDGWRVLTF